MIRYIFVLGNASALCQAELNTVINRLYNNVSFRLIRFPITVMESLEKIDVVNLIGILGGTIKISKYLVDLKSYSLQSLIDYLTSKATHESNTIGISNYSKVSIPIEQILAGIKAKLNNLGIKTRYILPKDGSVLSSIVVKKQKINEYLLVDNQEGNGWIIGKTLIIQDSDEWSKRDYNRPFAQPQTGMLPLKVARMMVNLASLQKGTILDPFCGMGTILQEALLLGFNTVGSDFDSSVITKAQQNLEWLGQNYHAISNSKFQLFVSDATQVSQKIKQKVDAIVTEPFLGSPFEAKNEILRQKGKVVNELTLANMIKGLEKLYIGAFKDWHKILKDQGKIIIALPQVQYKNHNFFVKKLIDNCENLGYTRRQGPYLYARPQAIVKRQIFVFSKLQD